MSSSVQKTLIALLASGAFSATALSQSTEIAGEKATIEEPAQKKAWSSIEELIKFRMDFIREVHDLEVQQMYKGMGIEDVSPQYHFRIHHLDIREAYDQCEGGEYDVAHRRNIFRVGCTQGDIETHLNKLNAKGIEYERRYLRHTIRHESGHHYFFKRARELGITHWEERNWANPEIARRRVIKEGFAEYMANFEHDPFLVRNTARMHAPYLSHLVREGKDGSEMEVGMEEVERFPRLAYPTGYYLLKPILDKAIEKGSFDRGLKLILENPIGIDNNLVEYQKRMLKLISE